MSTVNKITVTKNSSSNTYGLKDIDALRSAALTNVENEFVATKAYAINDYLYRDDIFYKVIAPIPRGGTFVINQNIKATILTNELAMLNPTVIANPTGEATGELETLQVGNIIYGVGGGGSATLEGLEDTVIEEPIAAQPLTYDEENEVQINGGIIPVENGGTGNTTGYIKTGQKEGSTIGDNTTIEGINNVASGTAAHAEGQGTSAIGDYSHAEGSSTCAYGMASHAEGQGSTAVGSKAHAEGANTYANYINSHAEGTMTTAEGEGSHAEGGGTYAKGLYSHSEGNNTTAFGQYAHAEGAGSYAITDQSHAEGYHTTAQGNYSHSEGMNTSAVGHQSHAEGNQSTALGDQTHSEGYKTYAVKDYSHAEGSQTCAPGLSAHSENYYTKAIGDYSHAEGNYTTANGDASHAEGYYTYANSYAHAEGSGKAYGSYSHAEGSQTNTSKQASHAEGSVTYAIGEASHAEGYCTTAEGDYSHSQGNYTTAKGNRSSAAGKNTIAGYNDQFVLGYYNDNKEGNLFEIGNGTYETKSNALEVDAEGNLLVSGSITDGDGNTLGPGGTTVIANPAAASTDTLTKLQVGSTVYGISGGGGASTLAALTDTTITSPSNGQYLVYDDTSNKQINTNGVIGSVAYNTSQDASNLGSITIGNDIFNINPTDVKIYNLDQDEPLDSDEIQLQIENQDKQSNRNDSTIFFQIPTGTTLNQTSNGLIINIQVNLNTLLSYNVYHAGVKVTSASVFPILNDVVYALVSRHDETLDENVFDIFALGSSNSSGASTLAALTDTTITSPTAAQPLTYDATNSKWINGGVIPAANGGTGNTAGYIQTGRKANTTIGTSATIEGTENTVSGNYSHAEGSSNKATAVCCHVEGSSNEATANNAHAEGNGTKATGNAAHAEGATNTASGACSHVGGNLANATSENSFAHGYNVYANGKQSIVLGRDLNSDYDNQCAVGKFNDNKSTSIFEVGIGTANNARANGLELDTSGNLKVAGTITDGNGNVLNQHFDQTVTLSTSAQTTATFTNAVFTTSTCVDIALTEQGLVPDDVVVTTGSCTVTLPIVDTAHDVTVRVYVR